MKEIDNDKISENELRLQIALGTYKEYTINVLNADAVGGSKPLGEHKYRVYAESEISAAHIVRAKVFPWLAEDYKYPDTVNTWFSVEQLGARSKIYTINLEYIC